MVVILRKWDLAEETVVSFKIVSSLERWFSLSGNDV
jgi:hypothetical protein